MIYAKFSLKTFQPPPYIHGVKHHGKANNMKSNTKAALALI